MAPEVPAPRRGAPRAATAVGRNPAPAAPRARGVAGAGMRWASPQVLISAFLLVLAVVYLLSGGPSRVAPPPALGFAGDAPPAVTVEVRYVVVDAGGLERPGYADAALPAAEDAASGRLGAALGALRDDLSRLGVWPDGVEAPVGYVLEFDRRRVAVVDVPPLPPGTVLDVARELTVARSLVATARVAAQADDVRVTVGGEERRSLWGRVAVGGG